MSDFTSLIVRAEWTAQAACIGVDPELFFPERGASLAAAKAVCRECPVQAECLAYALNTGEKHGIWGGKSERERRAIRRNLNQLKRPSTRQPIAS